jgi:membrane glycosyltransferase
MLSPHVRPINRLHLFLGMMSYLSSPLWFLFMVLGTLQFWIASRLSVHTYADDIGISSFLDIGGNRLAILLFATTIFLLFLPKLLSLFLILRDRRTARLFGGRLRVTIGVFLEHFLSIFITPILMLFHSRFVLGVLAGQKVSWNPQRRGDRSGIHLREAVASYWAHTLIGISWGLLAGWINPAFFWWMSPIFIGLIISIPFSILLSKESGGAAGHQRKLLLTTPQENSPPAELAELQTNLNTSQQQMPLPESLQKNCGFMNVVIDPYVNAIHITLLRRHSKRRMDTPYFQQLLSCLIAEGPDTLNRREQMALLMHRGCIAWLHEQIWTLSADQLAPWWVTALHQYNQKTALSP